jgi:hypothetical protein
VIADQSTKRRQAALNAAGVQSAFSPKKGIWGTKPASLAGPVNGFEERCGTAAHFWQE